MRKINYFVMFIVLFGLMFSCKKEQNESINFNNSLIIGKISPNITITTFDTSVNIIAAWHNRASYQFDINGDGIADFKLNSNYDISPGGVNQREVSIEILNSTIQISVITLLDTIYQCKYIENDTIRSITYYNRGSGYSCYGNNLNSFSGVDTTICPKIYAKGDTISNKGNWISNTVYLSFFNNNSFWLASPVQNTCILIGNWNNSNMKYLLFRIANSGKFLYGWLRLSVDEYNQIRFYEYALQNK